MAAYPLAVSLLGLFSLALDSISPINFFPSPFGSFFAIVHFSFDAFTYFLLHNFFYFLNTIVESFRNRRFTSYQSSLFSLLSLFLLASLIL